MLMYKVKLFYFKVWTLEIIVKLELILLAIKKTWVNSLLSLSINIRKNSAITFQETSITQIFFQNVNIENKIVLFLSMKLS